MINLLWSGIVFVLLLSGCGWSGTPTRQNDFTPLASIEISAVSSTIAAGTSTKLSATGVFVGGLPAGDITDKVIWSSDTPLVASFPYTTSPNKNRVVGGLAPGGTAIITATVGGVSSTFTLTVSNATVTAVTITPVAPSISVSLISTPFAASGTFSDSTTQDLTFDATWASTDTTVATVSNDPASKGFVQAIAVGPTTISATFGGVSGSTLLKVTVPVLLSITILPANPSVLSLSTSGSFTATGHFSDGSTPDITNKVTWTSSVPAFATIATTGGAATTLSQGTTSIIATPLSSVPSNLGVTGTTALKVTGGNLFSFIVSPAIVTLVNNTNTRMTATGTFSNGSMRDITGAPAGAFAWSPADPSLASVTAVGGNLALLNALAVTPATIITAKSGTLIPFPTTLTVIAAQLASITISTTSSELTAGSQLTAGTSARFTVTANFNGAASQDVTSLCGWSSNNTAAATVGASGFAAGRVTGVANANGSATITATYTNNGITAVPVQATVAVTARTLKSLSISPVATVVGSGNQVKFTATATYIGFSKDVTEDTKWTIDNPNVAIMADSVNQPGQVVGVDIGLATLTASFGALTPTTTVTVTGP